MNIVDTNLFCVLQFMCSYCHIGSFRDGKVPIHPAIGREFEDEPPIERMWQCPCDYPSTWSCGDSRHCP